MSASLQALLNKPLEVDDESRKMLRSMSAINFVTGGLPPFLLMQGDADRSVPYSGSLNFMAKLKENGVECELITLKGGVHNIGKWSAADPAFEQKYVDWLSAKLGGATTRP